ncbi:DEAD/DEAH box helicase, partial [Gordoniibacillus kamchatkensis]|uniref:DEAD/DEAH box helicase n=1 Tax=Gordoniibacillus kamchatkensis TaxID=1590651 RepID=UPI000695F85D
MTTGFGRFGLDTRLLKALKEQSIIEPTAVQEEVIPLGLEGRDVIAQSQTGTGKTLAYLLPALQRIDASRKELQALVLVPTRELGMQIVHVAEAAGKESGVLVQQLIGGAALQRQIDKLKLKPHFVVGTPGRVLELIKLRKLNLQTVRTFVIDEADQVFSLGSTAEVEAIMKSVPRGTQTMLFSATVPPELEQLAQRWMKEPAVVRVNPGQRTAPTLEHVYFVCDERDKIDTLRRLVHAFAPKSAIVFVNATADLAEVVQKLQYVGLSVEALYSEAGKQERANVLSRFRAGKFQLLLATDVAARGLDVAGVTHVFNLDPAPGPDYYVHRVGRTGRMGRPGTAASIVTPQQTFIMDKFAKRSGWRSRGKRSMKARSSTLATIEAPRRSASAASSKAARLRGARAKAAAPVRRALPQ